MVVIVRTVMLSNGELGILDFLGNFKKYINEVK